MHAPWTAGLAHVLGLALGLWPVSSVRAAELHVIGGGGIAVPLNEIAAQFERASRIKVVVRYGTAPELIKMAAGGALFDIGVVPRDVWNDPSARGRIVDGSMADIARSGIGVAVRAGTPKPDIGTTEALKQTLLTTRAIASIPASATGNQLSALYERLGITEAMQAKTRAQPTPAAIAEAVAGGDADLAVFTLNVLIDPRLDIVGPLPAEVQRYVVYAAAFAADGREPEAAKAFAAYLVSPAAVAVFKAKGLTPG